MSAYVFTPEAEEDLFEIWLHIARDSPESADRVESELHNAWAFLASSPYAGHNRPDLTTLAVRFTTRSLIRCGFCAFSMEPGTLPPKPQLRDNNIMTGIQFVTDERGRKVAVQIDLKKHRALWEDIEDVLVSQSRRHEKRIPFQKVKADLIKSGKLPRG